MDNANGKRGKDVTRTQRQERYLQRLADSKGKRIVIDLDPAGADHLAALIQAGYGTSNKAVVLRALGEAAEREMRVAE